MATDTQIRALARRRIARHQAVKAGMRQKRKGSISLYLRIEARELAKLRLGRLAGWLPVIRLPRMQRRLPRVAMPRMAFKPRFPRRAMGRLMLVGVVASVPLMAMAWVESSAALADLDRAMACAETTALIDADGDLVGAIPVLAAGDCTNLRTMVTAPFDPDLAQSLARAIAVIEGEYSTSSPWVWGGHDIRGFARKIGQGLGLLPGRGFSSPLLTSVETTLGEHNISFWRKLVLIVTTSRFVSRDLPDDENRVRFITTHMPSMLRAGYPRAGRLGAALLFGGRMPETPAEICQLARASGFPVWTIGDRVTARAARTWATSVGPGAAACARAMTATPEAEAEALADLRAACGSTDLCLSPPPPPLGVPEEMARRGLDAALIDIAEDRMPRYVPLTPDGNAGIVVDDTLRLSGSVAGGLRQTTLDNGAQQAMTAALAPALDRLDRHLPPEVCLTGQCAHRADHTVILAELLEGGDVAIRAIDVNRHGALAGWPNFDTSSGTWVADRPRFGLGSTSKVLLVLAAEQNGIERLCSNPSAEAQCIGGTWMPIRQAIARSDSDAMQWLAGRVPGTVSALQAQLEAPSEPSSYSAFDAAYGIGQAALNPAQALALFGAILGDGRASVRLFDDGIVTALDLTAAGISPAAIAASRRVLDAPLVDAHGTLSAVGRVLQDRGFTPLAGKTGTHTERGINLVRTSTLAFADRTGRTFLLHISITATETETGLGALNHTDLVPSQIAMIDALASL